MAHRLSLFGPYGSCRSYTYLYRVRLKQPPRPPGTDVFDLDIKFIQPSAVGPRLETMDKGPSIGGHPGGVVHGVDHIYFNGVLTDLSNPDLANNGVWTEHIIVPLCDFDYNEAWDMVTPPPLPSENGSCQVRLESVRGKHTRLKSEYTIVFAMCIWCLPPFFTGVPPWEGQFFPFRLKMVVEVRHDLLDTMRYINRGHLELSPEMSSVNDQVDIETCSIGLDSTTAVPVYPPAAFWDMILKWWDQEHKNIKSLRYDKEVVRDAAVEAVQKTMFTEAISFENVKDIANLVSTCKDAAELGVLMFKLIKTKNPLLLIKVAATAYLMWRYVVKTSYKDLKDFCHFGMLLWEHRDEWYNYISFARGRSTPVIVSETLDPLHTYVRKYRMRLDLKPAPLYFAEYARCVGLSPTLEDFWDLIPFSFVVDWLITIGDTVKIEQIILDLSRGMGLDQLYVTTCKSSLQVLLPASGSIVLSGDVIRYTRNVSTTYSGATYPPNPFSNIQNPFKNFWAGTALIAVQLMRGKK